MTRKEIGTYVTYLSITDGSKNKSKGKWESILSWMIMKTESYQDLWDVIKAVLTGKFVSCKACIRKEWSQIDDISFYFKKLEKRRVN